MCAFHSRLADRRTVQESKGELTLTFRSIPLIHKRKAAKALREGNTELLEIKEDAATGTARLIWHVDPLPQQQEPNDGKEEANNEERTKWRTRESDQEYQLKVPFVVPSKPGEVRLEIPFDITWMPDREWKAHTYYVIDVRHSSLEVNLEQTALFSAGVEVGRDNRELRIFVFKALMLMGFKPDSFKWLK